ncbi:MAG: hypothetical protein TH68_01305 [Candidatus Synechococcus spongiarum 142]|uniref:Uncharacterized protein n=1 Tax=Candidatus Synechococcus spongiarum 142 TaxID=1608213 RepID=A0A6N3X6L7_9SYNE|nr:MAG: hypothetical protein TH68_01305 [Candidatus Synechococcus spongiarum 142]
MGVALTTQPQPEHRRMPVGCRPGGGAMANVQPGLTRWQRVFCGLQLRCCSRGAPGCGATLLHQRQGLSLSKGFHQPIPVPPTPLPAQAGPEAIQSQLP